MSNSSGLWWDEWTYPFGNEDNDAYQMTLSNDWVVKVLSTPMIREPGFEFNYNSGNGIIMAPILENITGVELEQYTKEKLFDPLSITDWKWERIPGDFVNASWGLHLRPIDMLKIGYLHLKQGIWNEEMLFNERWTSQSTRNRTDVSSFYRYGYFWWRFGIYAEPVRRLKQNDVFFSWGDGGQFIFVVPHLDLVIVSTAGNYASNDILPFTMFSDYIIDAVDDPF
jgi:CubicO group peptidase (beta-lactamase class C family)